MSSLLAKRLSLSPFSSLSSLTPLLRLTFSTRSSARKDIPFIGKYLTSSDLGFSPEQALKVSANKNASAIKSEDRADSVVNFLKDAGLSGSQIRSLILLRPRVLCCDVEKTLKPMVLELRDAGFSEKLLVPLFRFNPDLPKDSLSRLKFWREFVGKSEEVLLRIVQRNGFLMYYNIDNYVAPRLNLFKEYGLSNQDIVRVLEHGYSMSRNLDSLRQTLECIEELGIPRGSGMFLNAFKSIRGYTKDVIRRKAEFFKKTFGWSQEDLCCAFARAPKVLALSEDNIKSKMDFLVRIAKLDTRSIAYKPMFLCYSLEKRLVPRHRVLSILVAKGLKKEPNLSTACSQSEKTFLEVFVMPYKKICPELTKAYFASSDKKLCTSLV